MNYDNASAKIKKIREVELKQTQEEFAEEIGVSITTVQRLESPFDKVTNVETYLKIFEISGYTVEEILLDIDNSKGKEKEIAKINYLLNVLSKEELEYIYGSIRHFVTFNHRNQVNTLKNIKDKLKKD